MPKRIYFEDRGSMIFTIGEIGEIMYWYWENDKCTFSKLYKALLDMGIFSELHYRYRLAKRTFLENKFIPSKNIFEID